MLKESIWILKNPIRRLISPFKLVKSLFREYALWKRFWDSYFQYKKLSDLVQDTSAKQNLLVNIYPCLGEDTSETEIEPTYFYQDAWAFERIFEAKPLHHIDIGSHHKFVALLSKVLPVTMVDIRPLSLPLDTLEFKQGSILDLPFEDETVESLSSLCVVEHIGLGRYGDPLDPNGTEKAIAELKRVISPKGNLYISIPIDNENKVYFNAHRAFKESYLYELFHPFVVIDSKYICGNKFTEKSDSGFCVACYHLQKN